MLRHANLDTLKTPNLNQILCIFCDILYCVYMFKFLYIFKHACSVIKLLFLQYVCRGKSLKGLMYHCYVYSTINKSSMSMYDHIDLRKAVLVYAYLHKLLRYLSKIPNVDK